MFDPFDDKWPDYQPGPKQDIFAVGVIALNYGRLENAYRFLFSTVTRMNGIQVSAIFQRIPNNIRQTVLSEVMAQTTLPDKLKERVNHFTLGFKICADNRHDVMHSHSGGVFTSRSKNARGILFSKYSKSGKPLVCAASFSELKSVADEIHTYASFGFDIGAEISRFIDYRETGEENAFWRAPLKHIPAPATALRWHSPKDVLIDPSQPQSLPE